MESLQSIAKKMRFRKERGEFKTYRDAYRWAVKNMSTLKIKNLDFKRLERAYHKHHSSKDIKLKKVSIPIMITNKMRMELSTLGWSREEMKSLRPKCAWQIIKKGVPKKPPIDRAKNL